MAFVAMRLLDELAMRIGVDGIVISQLSFLSFFREEALVPCENSRY